MFKPKTLAGSILFAIIFCSFWTLPAYADPIAVGLISIDQVLSIPENPGPEKSFTILDYSGAPGTAFGANPPKYPVVTPVSFTNSLLTVTFSNGTKQDIHLGTFGPGAPADPSGLLRFPTTTESSSALFTATLSQTHLLLSDGSIFDASPQISTLLLPSTGGTLPLGYSDMIEVSPVPLPAGWLLMGSGLVGLAALRMKSGDRREVC